MRSPKVAVVLLSGGLDSAVALALCRADGFAAFALTIDYGQRNRQEMESARRIAAALRVEKHIVLNLDLTQWGGSALTDAHPVPTGRDPSVMGASIPITYVPGRNTIFLTLAMAWGETLGTGDVFIGAHTLDYSGYPDCRPEYFRAFEGMANLATKAGVERSSLFTIHAPLIGKTKVEIVRTGSKLGVPFELTSSCYQPTPDGAACGICDSCILRQRAFAEAGIEDPIRYVARDRSS